MVCSAVVCTVATAFCNTCKEELAVCGSGIFNKSTVCIVDVLISIICSYESFAIFICEECDEVCNDTVCISGTYKDNITGFEIFRVYRRCESIFAADCVSYLLATLDTCDFVCINIIDIERVDFFRDDNCIAIKRNGCCKVKSKYKTCDILVVFIICCNVCTAFAIYEEVCNLTNNDILSFYLARINCAREYNCFVVEENVTICHVFFIELLIISCSSRSKLCNLSDFAVCNLNSYDKVNEVCLVSVYCCLSFVFMSRHECCKLSISCIVCLFTYAIKACCINLRVKVICLLCAVSKNNFYNITSVKTSCCACCNDKSVIAEVVSSICVSNLTIYVKEEDTVFLCVVESCSRYAICSRDFVLLASDYYIVSALAFN